MEPIVLFILYSLLLVAVSLTASYLPILEKMRNRDLHIMIELSAGLFLGMLMFILFPEGIEESIEGGVDVHHAMIACAVGFIAIMAIESLMRRHDIDTHGHHMDGHEHEMASFSTFIGLAIHAACDGLALAALFISGGTMGLIATIGLCVHKFVELFSLSSAIQLSNLDKRKMMIRLGLFSLITPVAGLLFFLLFSDVEIEGLLGIPLLFAAGTLLYVTTCDIIPDAFHHDDKSMRALLMTIIGVGLMLAVSLLFPHSH